MLEIIIGALLLMVLMAILFWAVGWEITIGMGTFLVLILMALLIGAVGMIIIIAIAVER